MKLMVVGGGAREHALTARLAADPGVEEILCVPGNPGIAAIARTIAADSTSPDQLLALAVREHADLTVVGPEVPLSLGVADRFAAASRLLVGPSAAAARLETSKAFAKSFMARHGIPTALHRTFDDAGEAKAFVAERGAPLVVKADGLAAGKGVVVAASVAEAHAAIDRMMTEKCLGAAGARLVVEQFLDGEEASFIVMSDGAHVLALATSQDHKRLRDGDTGPNTGGMGAYSPAPVVTPEVHARVMREIIVPTVEGMARDGTPYVGFLYAGLMIDRSGSPKALEFNCRLGDPETQPIILRLKSDLLELVERALEGTLDQVEAQWDRRAALGVVLAAAGYPEEPRKGDAISALPKPTPECRVFHAGTRLEGKHLVTNGGRVLCVTALGDSIRLARARAYGALEGIRFEGMQYRKDIAHRALKKNS